MDYQSKAHTGEHILFQALSRRFPGIRAHKVVIDDKRRCLFCEYDGELFWEGVYEAEEIANRIISEKRTVKRIVGRREEMERRFPSMRAKWERIKDEDVSVVEVEDFDAAACSGEHVANTGEIGFLFVTGIKRKGNTHEIEFEVEDKAKASALQYGFQAKRLSRLAGTSLEKTYETFQNMKQRNASLEKSLECASAHALENVPHEIINEVKFYCGIYTGLSKRVIADRAGVLSKGKKSLVLLGNEEEDKTFLVLARSPDVDLDASRILGGVIAKHEGRGGGRKDFAQGLAQKEALKDLKAELVKYMEKFK